MFNRKFLIGLVFALISIGLLSIHAVIIKYLITEEGFSSTFLVFLRFFIGGIFLLIVGIGIYGKKGITDLIRKKKIYNSNLFLVSGLFLILNFMAFHLGLNFTTASHTMIIETSAPVLVVILTTFIFTKGIIELKYSKNLFFVALTCSIGTSLILLDNPVNNGSYLYKFGGDILALFAMIFFSFYLVYNHNLRNKNKDYPGLLIIGLILISCAIATSPLIITGIGNFGDLTNIKILGLLLLLGIGSTGISYLCRFFAAKYLNVITISLLFSLTAITTIIFEQIILSTIDFITSKLILGTILIIIATIYVEIYNSKINSLNLKHNDKQI